LALACHRLGVDALPPAAANLIQQKAQGHPFFCEELAYALRDMGLIAIDGGSCRPAADVDWSTVALPDSIQGVITNRIDRLGPTHQLTLKVSSVIGRLFPVRVLSDVFPIEPERPRLPELLAELSALDFTRLETPEPDLSYLFKHIIIQEVSYNMLLFAHRRQLHRSIATWYEQRHLEDLSPHYPLLAHHWGRADVDDKAVDYLEAAGEQAMRGGAYSEAVVFLKDALRLDSRTSAGRGGLCGTARCARWEAKLGEAYLGLGQLALSREHTERALRLLGHPVPGRHVHLVKHYAIQLSRQVLHWLLPSFFVGRSREAIEILRWSSRAHDVICQVCYYSQDVTLGVFCALRALNLAERSGPCPELARSYGTMCIVAGMVPLHALAEAYGRRALKTVEVIDDLSTRAWVSQTIGMYWLTVGRWQQSRAKLSEAVESTRRIGDWRRWEESLAELARLEYLQGDFGLGAELFAEMGRVAREQGHEQAQAWSLHGQSTCLLRKGRIEETVGMLEKSPALQPGYDNVADMILGLGLLALARLRIGQCDLARHDAEETLRRMERTRPMANFNMEGYAAAAEVFLTLWEENVREAGAAARIFGVRAHSACKILRQFAWIFPMARPRAWAWWGWYWRLSGRPGHAWVSWRRALQYAEQLDMPYEKGLIHFEIGRHAEVTDPARIVHLESAHEIFSRLGAADDLGRIEMIKGAAVGPR
jgi:tetratricopeptide (TPR) repeat protein